MISALLTTLENGFTVIKSNTKLLLVAILVFVFPLLFIWITQEFFATAQSNITTAEKQRIGILHDALGALVLQGNASLDTTREFITQVASDNPDITQLRILEVQAGEFSVVSAYQTELEGKLDPNADSFKQLPLTANDAPLIFPLSINGVRTWQVFRSVETADTEYIIFSEHQFRQADSVMLARKQQSYFGLTAIFIFLMALAYWLNRQIHWRAAYEDMKRKMHERDLFSNMIAHEFRAPLTAIKGYASLLQESETLDNENKRFAETIRMSAERLVYLVSDFLEVARLQSGKLKITKQEVDIRDTIERVVADVEPLATEHGLTVSYNRAKAPIRLTTDEDRLIQVLTNIISNSLKYTKQGGVEVVCEDSSRKLTIRIKDTGMGISAEDQAKLFAPFTRVGGVDQTDTTGTGLGMWITKQLVTLLDGRIGVESIKGVGTHIVISFPKED